MRAWPLMILLAGCLGAPDAADPTPAPVPTAPATDPATDPVPLVVEVLNATIELPLPGGEERLDFDVPAGYLELYIATPGDVRLEGQVRVTATDPDGTEHVLLEGTYADAPGLRCPDPCTWRLEPVPGSWRIDASVDGAMRLPLTGRAQ